MTVDVQCEMQGLKSVADCYHTKLITTSDRAKIEGAEHIEFHPETWSRYSETDIEEGH